MRAKTRQRCKSTARPRHDAAAPRASGLQSQAGRWALGGETEPGGAGTQAQHEDRRQAVCSKAQRLCEEGNSKHFEKTQTVNSGNSTRLSSTLLLFDDPGFETGSRGLHRGADVLCPFLTHYN